MTDRPLPDSSHPTAAALPAAKDGDSEGVLDGMALARLRELDPSGSLGVLRRVLGTFEGALQRMLPALQAARDSADLAALGALAHTLRSSSASIGAVALARHCAVVEALTTGHAVHSATPTPAVSDASQGAAGGGASTSRMELQPELQLELHLDGMTAEAQRALGAVRTILGS